MKHAAMSRRAVDFPALGGSWGGPSPSGNVWYGLFFLEELYIMCSAPNKNTIQIVTSNKSKSQGLSWYEAKVTYTSVMAPLPLKST